MSLNIFPAILEHPQKIKFIEQEHDEHIELFLRQHWVTNVGWIFLSILAAVLPFFVPSLLSAIDLASILDNQPGIQLAMLVLWYLLILAYIIERYLFWYFNVYMVTTKHILDIVFPSILTRSITEAQLDDIQSVKSRLSGIIRSLFNYGDVIIETAARKQNIEFLAVPRPDFVTDLIGDLRERKGVHHAP